MPIYVHINEAGALRNQRYAFTDRFTLVSELLQNARRAGATRVEVSYDEDTQTLCVRDDGAGIDDFQALLSIYASRWPTALCMEEQAFGVGFSQCLYLARQCRVASKGQVIDFDCAAALAQQPIAVLESAEFIDGTWVTLYGVELPDWQARIERLCVGFAVEVGLNHQPLPRPLALTQLQTQTTPLGQVYLLSRDDGWSSTDLMVFLQGFCVWRSPYCRINQANVIHLDPRQFLARLPDRDKLLDEELQLPHIKATLQQCWQQVLHEQLQHLGETLFLQRYYHSVQCWEQWPLLNALTVLPAALCQRIDDYPQQSEPGLEGYLQPCSRPFDRQAIEQGAVQLVALNPLDEQNAALWMFARAMGFVLCDPARLDPQHWVHPHVRVLDALPVRVSALGEQQRTDFDGRWVSAPVVLCEVVRVSVAEASIDLVDEALCHQGVLYIPYHAWSGTVVRQASGYLDEYERHHGDAADADEHALAQLIQHLRCRDPQQTLLALLTELHLSRYPALRGQRFVLDIGDQASGLTVECAP